MRQKTEDKKREGRDRSKTNETSSPMSNWLAERATQETRRHFIHLVLDYLGKNR